MMNVTATFERGRDGQIGPTLGPYPGLQLTYNHLRSTHDGETIAIYDPVLDDWLLCDPEAPYAGDEGPWSDVIIGPDCPGKEAA